jgi:hypothetical protein
MRTARWIIIIVGIFLPYIARIPGTFEHGDRWLTSYLDTGLAGFLLIGLFNAIWWGAVLLAIRNFKSPKLALWPALLGAILPFCGHATLDLASDAQAGILLVIIPFFGLPGVVLGYWISRWQEKRQT